MQTLSVMAPIEVSGHRVGAVGTPDDLRTIAVTAGRPARTPDAPLNTPIVAASSFIAGGPMDYARDDSPTVRAFEDALGALEGGTATAFSSGMAAANAALDLVPMAGIVVVPEDPYAGTGVRLGELADIGRIARRQVDISDTAAVIAACAGADLLWLETPTNPLLVQAELAACIAGAHAAGCRVLVDNTFATPILQRPLAQGADLVLHSVTKAIGGHSDLLMGVVVAADADLATAIHSRRVSLGAVPSAFDAFLALRGLRTLAIRVERAQENARHVVERLREHPKATAVRYPGWGTIASFEAVGDEASAERVCNATRIWTYATSLGGVESLLERRRRHPHENPLVPATLIRLSFGIEAAADLWADLAAALDAD